jgi:hypothetical protein
MGLRPARWLRIRLSDTEGNERSHIARGAWRVSEPYNAFAVAVLPDDLLQS